MLYTVKEFVIQLMKVSPEKDRLDLLSLCKGRRLTGVCVRWKKTFARQLQEHFEANGVLREG